MASGNRTKDEKTPIDVPKIFDKDEMSLKSIDPNISSDELLNTEGVYYLKDVAKLLEIAPHDLKRRAHTFEDKGRDPWEIMGVRKTWSHWIIRMTRFSPYFRKFMLPRLNAVESKWDSNEMLAQKGIFYLSEVCEKLPLTPHHIKYQVRRNKKSREQFGVWKDIEYKTYLVDMEVFSKWIEKIWNEEA